MIVLYLSLLLVALGAAWFAKWAFIPHRELPGNRTRHLRWRLHLRVHPGRGHATLPELWWHWGRFAAWRTGKQTRRSLSIWQRVRAGSAAYSIRVGRAHYRHGLRVPLEENVLILGPPRAYKSALLAKIIVKYPGAVLATSTKTDLYGLTSGLRARNSRPPDTFNPQGIGGDIAPSTFGWNPVKGCTDRGTAIRRADDFTSALPGANVENENSQFFTTAADLVRALFHAAAFTGGDMLTVARWIKTALQGGTISAEAILERNGAADWAASVKKLRGAAEKTAGCWQDLMDQAVGFMNDPALAAAVRPDGNDLDVEGFLRDRGTMFLIADPRGKTNPALAPLFAALVSEVHFQATRIGQASRGGRLDPPLLDGPR